MSTAAADIELPPTPSGVAPDRVVDPWTEMLLVAAIAFACLILFADKPLHMDDPLFVWTAHHILQAPTDFYGFDVNWYGTVEPMHRVNQNPPLAAYLQAAVGLVFGFQEWLLHGAFLLVAIAMLLGVYQIARELTAQPQTAALATLFAPVTLVSATSLMCDTLMLAFWCWAIVCWLWAMRADRPLWPLVAGLMISLGFLSKYFALALVPLLLAYALVVRPRFFWWKPALAIPVVVAVLYEIYAHRLYGHGLIFDALRYVGDRPDMSLLRRLEQSDLFIGGCLVTFLFLAPMAFPRWLSLLGLLSAIVAAAGWLAQGGFPLSHTDVPVVARLMPIHIVAYTLATVSVIGLVVFELLKRRDAASLLLTLWIGGTVAFAAFGNWATTARTILPIAPAVAILLVRRIDERETAFPSASRGTLVRIALTLAAFVSLAVAHGDVLSAKSARRAAKGIYQKYEAKSSPVWFEGHWGFQYYMQLEGAEPVDVRRTRIQRGQIIVLPFNNTNVEPLAEDKAEQIEALAFRAGRFTSTVSVPVRAKFYAAFARLSVPIVFGPIPPDLYLIEQAKLPIQFQAADATVGSAH